MSRYRTNLVVLFTLGGILLCATSSVSGQTPKPTPPGDEIDPGDVIRITTNLVTTPVRVINDGRRYVHDMRAEEFRIFEEGVEQQVAFFAPVESPFTVLLMLDISDSTESSLKDIKEAAFTFISQLKPNDSVIIAVFDSGLNVLAQPTSDRQELRALLDGIKPGKGTRLYDALDLISKLLLPQIKERKAIVLFTDGVDIDSRITAGASLRKWEESDALIYTIHYNTYFAVAEKIRKANSSLPHQVIASSASRSDYDAAHRYLNLLADRTGGRMYEADDTKKLTEAFTLIADELRWQYTLGYYPNPTPEVGQRRRIKVRVARKGVLVYARDSYTYTLRSPRQ